MTQSWYYERPEEEATFRGVLVALEPVTSPGGRTRLLFELQVSGGFSLPIYGPKFEAALSEHVGREVSVVGKVVDLSDEGFGVELWIGRVG